MSELGQTIDPTRLVPGSVSGMGAAGSQWRRRADTANDAAASLQRLAAPEGWEGQASEAFEVRVAAVAGRWVRLSTALTAAASALEGYSSTVAWAQRRARVAIETWERGQAASAAVRTPVTAGLGTPWSAQVTPSLSFTADPGIAIRYQAQQILADARAQVAAFGDAAAASIRAAANEPDLGPDIWAALGSVNLTPAQAVTLLAGLDGSEVARLLTLRPDLRDLLRQAPPSMVRSWWAGLDSNGQDALIHAAPALIGNLEGVAYTARDQANRRWLEQQIAQAREEIADAEEPLWMDYDGSGAPNPQAEDAGLRLAALENIQAALVAPNGAADRFLVSLTGDDLPLAAVAVGSLDTADSVTYAIPGMGATTAGMRDWATSAQQLAQAQNRADSAHSHAVVAWIGYETPPVPFQTGLFDVLLTHDATVGAEKLGATLTGFEATRPDAVTNVVAHSYGTTTASLALTQPGVSVQTFVSVGSAGLPPSIDQASDIQADQVFAGQARNVMAFEPTDGDQWAWTGRWFGDHPVNPVGQDFGAHVFGTDTGVGGLPVTDHGTHTNGGTGYLDRDTESLANIALATTGQGANVTPDVVHPLTPLEQGLLDGMTGGIH